MEAAGDGSRTWAEDDSSLYRRLAPVAVPARAEQLAVIATLVPGRPHDELHIVDVGCGEGALASCLLRCFPKATVLCLDGSASMRSRTAHVLRSFAQRVRVEAFDLRDGSWWPLLEGADAVVSSLVFHHLDAHGKQRLFAEVAQRLSADGALVIADLVAARRRAAEEVFAATWEQSARAAAHERGDPGAYEAFVAAEWNLYRHPDPEVDRPSPLYEQLRWLEEAGLVDVDCFWLRAGHAIYGGFRAHERRSPGLTFEEALRAAEQALAAL